MKSRYSVIGRLAGLAVFAGVFLIDSLSVAQAQPGGRGGSAAADSVDLTFRDSYAIPGSDARTDSIVALAKAFAATLTDAQQQAVQFEFTDNAQRANWSNLPEGVVQRDGLRLGELSNDQRAALDRLLAETLSESGIRNVELQLIGDDMLASSGGRPNFGSDFYFVSFLGEPSTSAPWMLQFGGHHLAVNVSFFGSDASFSPMLTGGQPLHVNFEGSEVHVTERELTAAQAFMDSLSAEQRSAAIRSDRAINLLLGPGGYGTVVAPEGLSAATLGEAQRELLLNVVAARLGFINDDDYGSVMARIEAEIGQTFFGWWGPLDAFGAAYFRVTGPSIVMEYAPQGGGPGGGAGPDHAHAMYRDPTNDYGSGWLSVGP